MFEEGNFTGCKNQHQLGNCLIDRAESVCLAAYFGIFKTAFSCSFLFAVNMEL